MSLHHGFIGGRVGVSCAKTLTRVAVQTLLLVGCVAAGFNIPSIVTASAQDSEEDLSLDFVKKQLAKVRARTPAADTSSVSPVELQAETDRLLAEESALLAALSGKPEAPVSEPAPAAQESQTTTKAAPGSSEEIRGSVAVVNESEREVEQEQIVKAPPATQEPTEDAVDSMLASIEEKEAPRAMASSQLPSQIREEVKESSPARINVETQRITSLQNTNNDLRRQLESVQRRLRDTTKELQESRNRLIIAETEVERLSHVLEQRNIATLARVAPGVPQNTQPRREYRAPQAPAAAYQPASNTRKESARTDKAEKSDMLVGTITVEKAHLRSGPGKNNAPLMSVARGTRLVIETRQGEWYRVITPTGTRAWVASEVLSFGAGGTGSPTRTIRIQGVGG